MKSNDYILANFLAESEYAKQYKLEDLCEEVKTENLKTIASNILTNISSWMGKEVDTFIIDRSKGEIKQLKELEWIQKSIEQLETIYERAEDANFIPVAKSYLNEIIQSLWNLNQTSSMFKDAYRNKKSLMILKYQSVILAIISALTYLISATISFNGNIETKNKVKISDISAFDTLSAFNAEVKNGVLNNMNKDVTMMREYYNEISKTNMNKILEAYEILPAIVDGIKNLTNSFDNNNKLISILYKASTTVALIMSLRATVYMFFHSRFKVADIFDYLKGFSTVNDGYSLNKLNSFGNKYTVATEEASRLSKLDIADENKAITTSFKTIPSSSNSLVTDKPNAVQIKVDPDSDPIFNF